MRRSNWIHEKNWRDDDLESRIVGTDALQEDLQDYTMPRVLVGTDVVNLYLSLDITETAREAVLESEIKWEEIDYLEGVQYIALNWREDQCNRSTLGRILPYRRGKG